MSARKNVLRLAILPLTVLWVGCSPGLPIPDKKLEPQEELAWNKCREAVEAKYTAFLRFFLEAPKADFRQCMRTHGYKLIEK